VILLGGEEVYIEHFILVEDIEILVYIATLLGAILFLYGLYRSYRRWTYGGQKIVIDHLFIRLKNLIKYGILQRKVLLKPFEGTMHSLIYIGFIILFIGTLLRALEADITLKFLGYRFLTGNIYLVFKLAMNIGGALAIIGLFLALIRRLGFKSEYLPDTIFDYLLIIDLIVILITGFLLDAISTYTYRIEWIDGWDPIGIYIASYLASIGNIEAIYRFTWLFHMALAIFSFAIIPFTKLYHILVGGLINTFFGRLEHPSAFKPIPDIDRVIESGGLPGANTLKDLTWKQRMDYDACIKCSRCTDNCPATLSGKPLSPMDLMLTHRVLMDKKLYDSPIVPEHVEPDIIWSCVTCGACVYQCPMLIHQVETIIDIRRNLLGSGENTPQELMQVSYNLMRYGNPMAYNPMDRENFVRQLSEETGVEIAQEWREYDYIYWMGCNTSYDPNVKNTAISLLNIFAEAGLNVAILPEEVCCGEPARRIGDELMFKELVSMNKENLSKYRFKKLIVNCPHGFNVFRYEYPQYGMEIDVIHHSQILGELIRQGKIKIKKTDIGRITFHDPCYLGRWNNIYDAPREVLKASVNGEYIEIPRSRENSFCCGGGGGHLFYELKRGERIGKIRMDEVRGTKANVLAVACPFCNIMMKSEAGDELEVKDISEILNEALD
jgi:Fe-S oxidoreductase/nitrate reductase gamma subunit